MKQTSPESDIFLCTNDKNLMNKSLINSLNSINFDDLLKKLKVNHHLKVRPIVHSEEIVNRNDVLVVVDETVNRMDIIDQIQVDYPKFEPNQFVYSKGFKKFYSKLVSLKLALIFKLCKIYGNKQRQPKYAFF